MKAMKEQMATMMEAMMSMKKIMEVNAVVAAATSVIAEVDLTLPSGLNQMNHPTSDMVGKDLGSTGGPMMCKFKTSTPSCHMACLPRRMSISFAPILIESQQPQSDHAHVSTHGGNTWNAPPQSSRLRALPRICH